MGDILTHDISKKPPSNLLELNQVGESSGIPWKFFFRSQNSFPANKGSENPNKSRVWEREFNKRNFNQKCSPWVRKDIGMSLPYE